MAAMVVVVHVALECTEKHNDDDFNREYNTFSGIFELTTLSLISS